MLQYSRKLDFVPIIESKHSQKYRSAISCKVFLKKKLDPSLNAWERFKYYNACFKNRLLQKNPRRFQTTFLEVTKKNNLKIENKLMTSFFKLISLSRTLDPWYFICPSLVSLGVAGWLWILTVPQIQHPRVFAPFFVKN